MIVRSTALALLVFVAAPALAQNVTHGSTLYHQTCITCHGLPPSGGPELAPNNPGLIAQAINGLVPQMGFLRGVYSTSDLTDIAAYIASLQAPSTPPPPPPPTTPPVPLSNYSDLWWNPNESGWGFNIIQHGTGVLFCVMFTYAGGDVPMWYVVPGGTWNTATNFTGAIYQVSGTAVNQPFVGSAATAVGTATLQFTDQNDATLTMTVNGTQVVKQIQRQAF
ncbi:MAG TPA: c-type cytochrome [Usitatibacter sp.]|nr:c-type cytochrome [Usitatibacter sp.]